MMDREIEVGVRRRRVARQSVIVAIAAAAVVFFIAATLRWFAPAIDRDDLRTARVTRGAIEATLQASGTVIPAGEEVISSPVEARVLRIVRRAGDRVRRGDEILALDIADARLAVDQLSERVSQKESERTQLRLRLEESAANLRALIETKKLDAEILRLQAERTTRLQAEGLSSEQEMRVAKAGARKSEIELAQLEAALIRATRSAAEQLNVSDVEMSMLRRESGQSLRQLDLARTRAGRDGVVTWVVNEEGATVRRGDIVARVADLSAFRVEATISDLYVSQLAAGMPVEVKLDETRVRGRIASVDPRIVNGVARFYIALDTPAHPKLRNNVRVDVFVVTGHRTGVLTLHRGQLGRAKREGVFVLRGDRVVKVNATWGLMGDEQLEVAAGLAEGDEVVVSDMTGHADATQLRVN
jgi:HlyD family secretion protein